MQPFEGCTIKNPKSQFPPEINTRQLRIYQENTSCKLNIPRYPTRKYCINRDYNHSILVDTNIMVSTNCTIIGE